MNNILEMLQNCYKLIINNLNIVFNLRLGKWELILLIHH
jgi:hypothetical protein